MDYKTGPRIDARNEGYNKNGGNVAVCYKYNEPYKGLLWPLLFSTFFSLS